MQDMNLGLNILNPSLLRKHHVQSITEKRGLLRQRRRNNKIQRTHYSKPLLSVLLSSRHGSPGASVLPLPIARYTVSSGTEVSVQRWLLAASSHGQCARRTPYPTRRATVKRLSHLGAKQKLFSHHSNSESACKCETPKDVSGRVVTDEPHERAFLYTTRAASNNTVACAT